MNKSYKFDLNYRFILLFKCTYMTYVSLKPVGFTDYFTLIITSLGFSYWLINMTVIYYYFIRNE
ncbi:hypothetical protein PMI10_03912 [Flavobacterium sp. CF136]|nr:hypothetical protein PMI10_03912 [Flavobacterium sp. CF136]